MFIDRHPAYALYRHWYDLTEQAPEFPAPPTDEPMPRLDESAAAEPADQFQTLERLPAPKQKRKGRSRTLLLVALALVAGLAAADYVVLPGDEPVETILSKLDGVEVLRQESADLEITQRLLDDVHGRQA